MSGATLEVMPQMEINQTLEAPQKHGSGPIVGIIIILIVVLLGALYFWGALLNSKEEPETLPLITGEVQI